MNIYRCKEHRFVGRMKDGSKVLVQFEDKGTKIPIFDQQGNPYHECTTHTSWWRLFFPEPRDPNGEQVWEDYTQVAEFIVDTSRETVDECRWRFDRYILDRKGVDMSHRMRTAFTEDLQQMRRIHEEW